MQVDIARVVDAVGKEKNVDKQLVLDALQEALIGAARKFYGDCAFEASYNEESGELELWRYRKIVPDEEFRNDPREIPASEAKNMDASANIGDEVGESLPTEQLGRIAAQAGKQVIVQKMAEAEKDRIVAEFRERKNQLVTGIVRRFDKSDILIDLGASEGVLPVREQIPGEKFKVRDKILCYVVDVKKSTRGPQIILSRAHPEMLIRLFEQEVAEISEGVVVIFSAARDPGSRSKISVYSNEPAVDPVGACVGMKGARVQAVVQELNGEKIDIIPFDRDPARFVCNALAPAEVSKVVVNERMKSMEVIVPDDQLSLAIGRRGQNVRLAAQLTSWKLEIRSETKMRELVNEYKSTLAKISELGELRAEILVNEGYRDPADVATMDPSTLVKMLRLTPEQAQGIIDGAKELAERLEKEKVDEASDLDAIELESFLNRDEDVAVKAEQELENIVSKTKIKPLQDPDNVDTSEAPKENLSYWMKLRGVGEVSATLLFKSGYSDYAALAKAAPDDVYYKTGLPLRFCVKLLAEAGKHE